MRLIGSTGWADDRLGRFERRRGRWRGSIVVAGASVPLILTGGRRAPSASSLALARTVASGLGQWGLLIGGAIVAQHVPDDEVGLPGDAASAWAAASVVYVSVHDVDGVPTIEIGLRVPWDDEHTLGARLRDGSLVELNGSVLVP